MSLGFPAFGAIREYVNSWKGRFPQCSIFLDNFCASDQENERLKREVMVLKDRLGWKSRPTLWSHETNFQIHALSFQKKTTNHWAVGATPKGKAKPRSPGDSADVFEGGSSFFWKFWLEELLMVASRWCNHFQWHRDWTLFGPILFCIFLSCVPCCYWNGQVQNERSIAEAEARPRLAVRASFLGGLRASKGPVINF